MTVTTTNTRAELNGNASAGPFQCGFRILTDSDLLVYVEGILKTLTTHYTVANAGTTTNATVTFTSGNYPASGTANVVFVRSVPYTQTADYQNNTALDAETLETSFDRGTMQIQQNISNSDRALKFGDTVTGVTSSVTEITTAGTARANKILGFDASGNISATLELGTNRGNWATSTAYVVRDLVKQNNGADSGTYGNIYLCITAHTSTGAHVTASDSANWQLIVDTATATTSATASATSATASATSATASATSATASATSATASATSATASATSATASATSATASAASATASSASEVAAKNSAAAVSAVYEGFADTYLGQMADGASASSGSANGTWAKNSSSITLASTSGTIEAGQEVTGTGIPADANILSVDGSTIVISENMAALGSGVSLTFTGQGIYGAYSVGKDGPALDNDGDALATGALYFNSSDNEMRIYDGGNWIAATSAGTTSLLIYKYVATGSQTTFTGSDANGATLSYVTNNINVYLNGVRLDATDYTASNGTSVVLGSGATASDELVVVAFKSFSSADMVPASTGGTFSANVSMATNTKLLQKGAFMQSSTHQALFLGA